jgi:hypothetical protein
MELFESKIGLKESQSINRLEKKPKIDHFPRVGQSTKFRDRQLYCEDSDSS